MWNCVPVLHPATPLLLLHSNALKSFTYWSCGKTQPLGGQTGLGIWCCLHLSGHYICYWTLNMYYILTNNIVMFFNNTVLLYHYSPHGWPCLVGPWWPPTTLVVETWRGELGLLSVSIKLNLSWPPSAVCTWQKHYMLRQFVLYTSAMRIPAV